MMVGMMTPSAAPMILIYARVGRRREADAIAATAWFAGGYLLAWTAFSLAATSAQWALERATVLTPMMASASQMLAGVRVNRRRPLSMDAAQGGVLIQLSVAAHIHLASRGLPRRSRRGVGARCRHGIHCIGCCWALMVLLFVGGVMNLFWIAGLAILVLLEKVTPSGRIIARTVGVIFMAGADGYCCSILKNEHTISAGWLGG